jgi:hypothetical protein
VDPVLGRRQLDESELARMSDRVDRLVDRLSDAALDPRARRLTVEVAADVRHLVEAVRNLQYDRRADRIDADRHQLSEWIADLPRHEQRRLYEEVAAAARRAGSDGDPDELITTLAEWITTADAYRDGLLRR